jgi:hypothetical protein
MFSQILACNRNAAYSGVSIHGFLHTSRTSGMEQISLVIYLVLEAPTSSCLISRVKVPSAALTVKQFNYN